MTGQSQGVDSLRTWSRVARGTIVVFVIVTLLLMAAHIWLLVIELTEAGLARLAEAVPVHLEGVSKLFIDRLDDQELAGLERALDIVTLHCSFG